MLAPLLRPASRSASPAARSLVAVLLVGLLASACEKDGDAPGAVAVRTTEALEGAAAAPTGAPAPPVVTMDATGLLFSFLDERGNIQAVSSVVEVPAAVRPRVLVVDLTKTPAERQAHKVAFFVDLTTQNEDGTYTVTVQSRYDAADPKAQAPSGLPSLPAGSVVVYSAVWCGYCKKAKAWMTEHDVPFIERDVERTPGAQAELSQKLKAANVAGGGIPVIDWGGTLVMGFDQRRLEGLLKDRAGPPPDQGQR